MQSLSYLKEWLTLSHEPGLGQAILFLVIWISLVIFTFWLAIKFDKGLLSIPLS